MYLFLYLVLNVIIEVHVSNVLCVYLEKKSDCLFVSKGRVVEELGLKELLLMTFSRLLTYHYPLLDYHLDIGCHLKRGVREIAG